MFRYLFFGLLILLIAYFIIITLGRIFRPMRHGKSVLILFCNGENCCEDIEVAYAEKYFGSDCLDIILYDCGNDIFRSQLLHKLTEQYRNVFYADSGSLCKQLCELGGFDGRTGKNTV